MSPAELLAFQNHDGKDEVREWVMDQIKNKGVSVTTIANSVGVSRSLMSQFIAGKPGSQSLMEKLSVFMARAISDLNDDDQESNQDMNGQDSLFSFPARTESGLLVTEDFRQVLGLCSMCLDDGEIGVVIGPAGTGKTTALKEFCLRENRAVYVRADITMSAKELLLDIAAELGVEVYGSRRNMSRQIVRRLKEDGTLIIIDEADLLINAQSVKKLEILRGIWDEAQTGLVLAGHPRLATYLVKGPGGRENLAQFYSRVRRAYSLKGVSRIEAGNFLAGLTIDKEAEKFLLATATSKSGGGLRRFTRLLKNTLDLADQGETITLSIVREADSLLVSPRSLGLEF